MSGHCRTPVAGRARSRALAGAVLPCGVHTAGGDRRHRLSKQGGDLRPAVQSLGRDHAHDRCRSQASRRSHRLHIGAAHMGFGADDVPGGGLSPDGSKWTACRPRYFLTVEVLSALFRRLFLQMLVAAHHAGHLQFFGDHARLADKAAFKAYLAPLRKINWVVYAKEPFAGPRQVLRYLSRYTHRIAISNRRLVSADENGVTFKYKD